MSDLTVISGNMFVSPGLVKTGELPVMDADISELEHKVSLLLQTYNNKLYEQTSWPWAGVTVPYAINDGKGAPWGSRPVEGLVQYGEPIGAPVDEDHLLGATPDAVRQVQVYFANGLTARRLVQGKDLRKDIWITGPDIGSLSAETILELAEYHRGPKELPGTDYAYVLSDVTLNPSTATTDLGRPLTKITTLTTTSLVGESRQFKVLVDREWQLQ